jgi:hypothetical protein
VFDLDGVNLKFTVTNMVIDAGGGQTTDVPRAYIAANTAFIFTNAGTNAVKVRAVLASNDYLAAFPGPGTQRRKLEALHVTSGRWHLTLTPNPKSHLGRAPSTPHGLYLHSYYMGSVCELYSSCLARFRARRATPARSFSKARR